jgi:hypothetical protein
MNSKTIKIDFLEIKTHEDFHNKLSKIFGFPEFYGKNINALIDCLSSLRYPEDEMSETILKKNESLILDVRNINLLKNDILKELLIAIEAVNKRERNRKRLPSIYLLAN